MICVCIDYVGFQRLAGNLHTEADCLEVWVSSVVCDIVYMLSVTYQSAKINDGPREAIVYSPAIQKHAERSKKREW